MKRLFAMFMALALTALVPLSAQASGGHDLNGAELSILWVVPFVCMLLSIAIGPLAVPHFWHHHFGKVALFWGLAFLVPCAMVFGLQLAVYQFVHVLFMEYVPFIILLFALFTIAGGVRLKGQLVGHACGERRAARPRDHPRQLDGNHRCGHAAHPAPAPGQ